VSAPISDGGPAFPVITTENTRVGGAWGSAPGMTLRDYFASAALTGLCANPGGPFQANQINGWAIVNCEVGDIAKTAYDCADAMIAAREKEPAP